MDINNINWEAVAAFAFLFASVVIVPVVGNIRDGIGGGRDEMRANDGEVR